VPSHTGVTRGRPCAARSLDDLFGNHRVLYNRPLHWEYFYDTRGKVLIRLYRTLGTPRVRHRAPRVLLLLQRFVPQRDGIIAYRRDVDAAGDSPAESLVIILNFSDGDVDTWIQWPKAGHGEEQIDKADNPRPAVVPNDGQWMPVRVSSNYRAVCLRQ
jgi:hypothetical protein